MKLPEFSVQAVADGYWEVFHDDDCGETFDWFGGGKCLKCGFRPDMQSIAARRTGKEPPSELATEKCFVE